MSKKNKKFKKSSPELLEHKLMSARVKKVDNKTYKGSVKTTYPDGSYEDKFILENDKIVTKSGKKR